MRYLVGWFVLTLVLAAPLWGANLRIVGCDVAWTSTASPSPTCYVLIVNEQGVTDRLSGWQLHLIVFPTDGAKGVLQFASVDLPRQPSEAYLLAGDSATLDVSEPPPSPLVVGPTNEVLLADYALSGVGNNVPSSKRTLLKADFTASEDAEGVFAIAVVLGEEDSFWASFDTTDFPTMTRGFEDIPMTSGRLVIGHVAVNVLVPEPALIFPQLAGLALVIECITARCRRRRQR